MNADLRLRAKTLDAVVIGARVREARIRAALTQGEAAGDDASTAYISRIESGSRRPSLELLERLAVRLGVAVEDFLAPDDDSAEYAEGIARVELQLDYAELALRTGQLEQAVVGSSAVVDDIDAPFSLRRRARVVRALAREAGGDLNEAIVELEELAADQGDGLLWIRVLMALSRCYRVSGDVARAADIGDWAAPGIAELGLAGTDEAVQLMATVAMAHFLRGDVNHAVRLCLQALDRAEELSSPGARASAYWNSSLFEASRGNVASALPLADRALSLLEHTEDARNLARLRTEIGMMQLRLDPPAPAPAIDNLERSRTELEWTSASGLDRARNHLGLAQARYLTGELTEAERLLDLCLAATSDGQAPALAGAARLLQSRIAWDAGLAAQASLAMDAARVEAAAADAGRGPAQLWFDIAAALEDQGDLQGAMVAYRRAGSSTGLRSDLAPRVERVGPA